MNMKVKVIKSSLRQGRVERRRPARHGGPTPLRRPGADLRCHCHRLLARAVEQGIELRCPRCKHDTLLTWTRLSAMSEDWRDLEAAE